VEQGPEGVLVIQTLAAAPLPGRRRRRARPEEQGATPELPLSRATAIRAAEPFPSQGEAEAWLQGAVADAEKVDAVLDEGVALVNRALFAQAAATADPNLATLSPELAVAVRIGIGEGEEVASGRFTLAHRVDPSAGGSRRHRRDESLRPQERVAAVLGRRERIDACEVMILRARSDLDGERAREAALQLRVGLEALLVELDGALVDPGHEQDMTELQARRVEAGEAANEALRGELSSESASRVRELVEICERVLRRRRVMRGG
jgi:hypothetical protein